MISDNKGLNTKAAGTMWGEHRTAALLVRLTPSEMSRLQAGALNAAMPVATYARCVLDTWTGGMEPLDLPDPRQLALALKADRPVYDETTQLRPDSERASAPVAKPRKAQRAAAPARREKPAASPPRARGVAASKPTPKSKSGKRGGK